MQRFADWMRKHQHQGSNNWLDRLMLTVALGLVGTLALLLVVIFIAIPMSLYIGWVSLGLAGVLILLLLVVTEM